MSQQYDEMAAITPEQWAYLSDRVSDKIESCNRYKEGQMKVKIKTAHGYLSFQPDGRIEYRRSAGEWEEIDLEGFTIEQTGGGGGGGPVEPPSDEPTPAMNAQYVAAWKSRLEAQGVSLSGPCGAFEITKRVVWGLRSQGAGLLSKPSGNNCNGYSTDYVVFQNGDGVDILTDGGGTNGPQWVVYEGEFLGSGRWRPPVQP